MKLLIISDNHGSVFEMKNILEEFKGEYEAVVHCGDSEMRREDLMELAGCPVYMAKGNCDYGFSGDGEELFEFGEHVCFVTHGDRYGVAWGTDMLLERAQELGADIVFYGHTHVPDYREYEEEGITMMNPGSLTLPRQMNPQRTFLMVEQNEDGMIQPSFYTI